MYIDNAKPVINLTTTKTTFKGINEIILPKQNKRDLDDIPKTTKKGTKFHFVSTLDAVLDIALKESKRRRG